MYPDRVQVGAVIRHCRPTLDGKTIPPLASPDVGRLTSLKVLHKRPSDLVRSCARPIGPVNHNNKAATLIERMEREGVISPANHAGKREILVCSD